MALVDIDRAISQAIGVAGINGKKICPGLNDAIEVALNYAQEEMDIKTQGEGDITSDRPEGHGCAQCAYCEWGAKVKIEAERRSD